MLDNFKGTIYFLKYCWHFSKLYIIYLLLKQLLTSLAMIISIIIPKYIVNSLFIEYNYNDVIFFITLLICLNVFTSFFINLLTNNILVKRMYVFKEFQIYLSKMVMETEFENIENYEYLNTREKAYKFLYGNGAGFGQILESNFDILGNIITLIGITGIIVTLDFTLVLVLILLVGINTLIDATIKKKNIQLNLQRVLYERRSSYFSTTFSDFRFGKEIRANGISNWLIKKYDIELEKMQNNYKQISKNNILSGNLNLFISCIQQIIMYSYIIYKFLKASLKVDNFTMYLTAISQFTSILRTLMYKVVDMQQYNSYYEEFEKYISLHNKVLAIDNLKPEIKKNNIEIEFVDVSYKYYNQKTYALKNISVKFNPKEKIAIIGENGSGKSTFIKLLLRIYKPTSGVILLNGIDIQKIDPEYYINLFSAVFQDFKFFSMSLKDNIVLNNNSDSSLLSEILNKCGLFKKISCLKNGLDTYIYKDFDKDGFEPSGGEAQKIAIARSLYRDSPIIILDEPTSALDPYAETEIYSQFDDLLKEKSVIYISHRLGITKFCNKILTFQCGSLIEVGTHDELIKKNGIYAELFNLQASYYI